MRIIKSMLAEGAVGVYDAMPMENARSTFRDKVEYADHVTKCIEKANCCIIVKEWEQFKKLRPSGFRSHMRNQLVVDWRRIYEHAEFMAAGIEFYAVWLGPVSEEPKD